MLGWVIQLGKAGSEVCSFEAVSQCAKHSSAGRFCDPVWNFSCWCPLKFCREQTLPARELCSGARKASFRKAPPPATCFPFPLLQLSWQGYPGEQCNRVVHTAALTGLFPHHRALFCTPFWHPGSAYEGRHWTSVTHLSELLRAPAKFSLGQTGKINSFLIAQLTYRHCVLGTALVLSVLFEAKHEKLFFALLLRGLQDRKGQ